MADKEEASGILTTIFNHLFTGGPQDGVIAALALIVIIAGVVCWQMYKRLMASEQERVKNSEAYADSLKELNKQYQETLKDLNTDHLATLKQLNESYQKFIQTTTSDHTESVKEVSDALMSVQLTLAEMKTLVSIIGTRGSGNGTL